MARMSTQNVSRTLGLGGWLCHFTTAQAAFEHIVPSGRLRMSPYRRMRDPFESKDLALAAAYFVEGKPNAEAGYFATVAGINRIHDAMRLLSLTRDAEEYPDRDRLYAHGWARARLWEHYAEGHAGVCLAFDREELDRAITSELDALGSVYSGPVEYTRRGFYGSDANVLTDSSIFDPGTQPEAVARHIERHHRDLFFLKTEDWESEREFRYALMRPGEEEVYLNYDGSLRYVVIGERFPEWQIPAARAVCDCAGVELRRMSWNAGQPFPGKL